MGSGALAQVNGAAPAEMPPAAFEGREFTDSRGCVFLRSTFGGEVTWIPRFGPDRRPVCDGTPTDFATVLRLQEMLASGDEAAEDIAEATPEAETEVEPARSAIQVVDPTPVPTGRVTIAHGKEPAPAPRRAATAPRQAAAPRAPRYPQADASGRHRNCPASAPFGQLVESVEGRVLVRCVTSPALFLDTYVNHTPRAQGAPIALPAGTATRSAAAAPRAAQGGAGRAVQVGSFSVPANATRLRARLTNAGLPARIHHSRGLSVVSVGPFASAQAAQSALHSVRGMGFSDAYLR